MPTTRSCRSLGGWTEPSMRSKPPSRSRIEEGLFTPLRPGAHVICGRVTPPLAEASKNLPLTMHEYDPDPELMRLRAAAVVEGVLQTAIANTDVTIHGAAVAVVGFGNIGSRPDASLADPGRRRPCRRQEPDPACGGGGRRSEEPPSRGTPGARIPAFDGLLHGPGTRRGSLRAWNASPGGASSSTSSRLPTDRIWSSRRVWDTGPCGRGGWAGGHRSRSEAASGSASEG